MSDSRVRRMEDEWVEVPAQYSDGFGPVDPIQLRVGVDDGQVQIKNVPVNGALIELADLEEGLKLVDKQENSSILRRADETIKAFGEAP